MGYLFPHVPGPLPRALSCPASSSGAGVDAGRLSRLRAPRQQCRRVTFVPRVLRHSLGCRRLLLRVGAGGLLYPEPSQPWAGVAACVVEAAQCGAKGGPLPPGETCVLGPPEPPASLGPCLCPDLCSVRAVLPTPLQQDKTLAWHQQGVSAQEAPPGLLGQLPGRGADRLCCLSMEWALEASAPEGTASSTLPGWTGSAGPLSRGLRAFGWGSLLVYCSPDSAHDPPCVPLRLHQEGACCRRAAVSSCHAG